MYQSKFCIVTHLPDINVAYVEWKKFCRREDYRESLLHAIEIMKANKGCNYVADTSTGVENEDVDISGFSINSLLWQQKPDANTPLYILNINYLDALIKDNFVNAILYGIAFL